jgi:hypothetical protein
MEQWRPVKCPKDEGVMESITGFSGAWRCAVCGLEVWDGDVPTPAEYEELVYSGPLQSASWKPYVSRSYVPGTVRPGGSSKSGRRWKKKKKVDLQNRYRMLERG